MNFTHYKLGYCQHGQTIKVTLQGSEANVRLLDDSNFASYKSGRRHTYHGGHFNRSPAFIPVPHSGNWHITIDLGGYAGQVNSSVQIL